MLMLKHIKPYNLKDDHPETISNQELANRHFENAKFLHDSLEQMRIKPKPDRANKRNRTASCSSDNPSSKGDLPNSSKAVEEFIYETKEKDEEDQDKEEEDKKNFLILLYIEIQEKEHQILTQILLMNFSPFLV